MPSSHPAAQGLSCSEAQLWISMRIDAEELPPDAVPRLDAHCVSCEPCRRWFEEEKERSAQLRVVLCSSPEEDSALERTICDAALQAGWDGRTLTSSVASKRHAWRRGIMALAAAAVVVSLAAYFVATTEPSSDGVPHVGQVSIDGPFSSPGIGASPEERLLILPDSQGAPWAVRFDRRHYRLQIDPDGSEENEKPRMLLEVEQYDPRYMRLASWPYQ